MSKLIVISGPSGVGKTSIVHHILSGRKDLLFSVSACSREKRETEIDGKDYYFLGVDDFQKKIKDNAFLEWEEVYPNQFYGTLKSEIKRIWENGKHVIFDVDVIGGLKIKKKYSKKCLAIFVMPPSVEILGKRLSCRRSETNASIEKRLAKAEEEIGKNKLFDQIILNENFDIVCKKVMEVVKKFINLR